MNTKKLIKIIVCHFLITIFCICIGYSQDYKKYSEELAFNNVEVTIRFYNKQIYYLESPIIIEYQIVNNGSEPFLFITSFNKIFTFDFDIFTLSNRKVEHSRDYIVKRRQFEPVLNDEITLKHNEVYGVRIDISEWFDFQEQGEYLIKGIFYPNLITDPEYKLISENELYLDLNPPYTEMYREKVRVAEIKKLKAESLPPYEVVEFILNALMEKDYEKYMLYIKLDKFVMQFENSRKKYLDAKDIDKPAVIEEFKQYLEGKNTLENIPFSDTMPTNFEIEETLIRKREAQVVVTEYFQYGRVTETKRYTYHLHLYGDKWLIENYDVVNIK